MVLCLCCQKDGLNSIEAIAPGSGLMSVVAIAREIRAGHYIAPVLVAFEYVAYVVTRCHVVKLLCRLSFAS